MIEWMNLSLEWFWSNLLKISTNKYHLFVSTKDGVNVNVGRILNK